LEARKFLIKKKLNKPTNFQNEVKHITDLPVMVCGLFYDAISNSDYIASSVRVIGE
jgi:hypothetical protein